LKNHERIEEEIMRYLLGQCSEEDQLRIEGQYLKDDDYLQSVLLAEGEMIDAYVQGRLTAAEREQFETYYLVTDERREKVFFAKSLHQHLKKEDQAVVPQKQTERRKSFLSWLGFNKSWFALAAAAAGLLLLACGWLAIEALRLRNQLNASQARMAEMETRGQELSQQLEEERTRNQQLTERIAELTHSTEGIQPEGNHESPPAPVIAMLTMTAGTTRDISQANTLRLTSEVKTVRLRLVFRDEDHQSYQAIIQNASGTTVWRQSKMPATAKGESKSVMVNLPAKVLANDDYLLTLSGITAATNVEEISDYHFRIVKK
jgi:hypothetical protein